MPRLLVGHDRVNFQSLRQSFRNIAEDPKGSAIIIAFMMLFFAICVGLQVIAMSSNFITGGSAAVMKKGSCANSYQRDTDVSDAARRIVRRGVSTLLSDLTLNYADSCYSAQTPVSQCRDVLVPTLPYKVVNGSNCPFPSNEMCMLGEDLSGVTFDTGFLSSNFLGINALSSLEFWRRTICAPVINNGTYIKFQNISDDEVEISYHYDDRGARSISETKFRDRNHYKSQNYDVQYETRSCYFTITYPWPVYVTLWAHGKVSFNRALSLKGAQQPCFLLIARPLCTRLTATILFSQRLHQYTYLAKPHSSKNGLIQVSRGRSWVAVTKNIFGTQVTG